MMNRMNNLFGYNGGSAGDGYGKKLDCRQAGSSLRSVPWNHVQTYPIRKGFYREHPAVARRLTSEIDEWLLKNEVLLQGSNIPRPMFHFEEGGFPKPIEDLLKTNYAVPTTIQSISWPVALSGRDIISIARTGSGKTLGFLLPGIVHTLEQHPRNINEGPSVLIMLPTRELAQQVETVAKAYCRSVNLKVACVFGGGNVKDQREALRGGVDICIATPGRLMQLMEDDATNLFRCSYLVLDEADRMLDMGFEPQIRKIVSQVLPGRQTLMFSATWPKEIRTLALDFQTDPVFLNVGSLELSANHNIQQYVEVLEETGKLNRLMELLMFIAKQSGECKTMIFVETKRKADDLDRGMHQKGWPTLCMHGDKAQSERERVIEEFRTRKSPILLCTDVASRGLDISDIKYVINYDYPKNSEDYVHRIGRTARHNKMGTSYTFFTMRDASKARDLIKVLEEANQAIPEQLVELAKASASLAIPMMSQFSSSTGAIRRENYGGYERNGPMNR